MFGRFRKRSSKTERLDRGEFTLAEYGRWHSEMWYIHRFFGEIRALEKSLFEEIDAIDGTVSVLDVAAGSGDMLHHIRRRFATRSIFTVAAESSAEAASSLSLNGLSTVRCNALALPFKPQSFDFVFCTLFLHHLDENEAANFLAQIAAVARRKYFIIDLDRRVLPYLAYRFFGRLLLQRFTRDDGALSILRAHRPEELRQIAKRAGLKNVKIRRSAINRLILSGST